MIGRGGDEEDDRNPYASRSRLLPSGKVWYVVCQWEESSLTNLRSRGLVATFIFLVVPLVAVYAPPTALAAVTPHAVSMAVQGDSHGFVPTAETVTLHGSVVDTFTSPTQQIRVLGWPGDSLVFESEPATAQAPAGLAVGISDTAPKSDYSLNRYRNSGRTRASDLRDLGLSGQDAAQILTEHTSNTPTLLADARTNVRSDVSPSYAPDLPIYNYTCYTISQISGEYQGAGCTDLYVATQNGGDWYIDTDYEVSVYIGGTQTCLPVINCRLHLQGVAWKVKWNYSNAVVKWSPTDTPDYGTCGSQSLTIGYTKSGVNIGWTDQVPVCPARAGLWQVGSNYSGAGWWGNVTTTNTGRSGSGEQVVHSPSGSPVSYNSYYLIWYCDGYSPYC